MPKHSSKRAPKQVPKQAQDVAMLSATELTNLYRRKQLSPVEVLEAVLGRIDAVDGIVNAFRQVDADAAMSTAQASEKRWLDGEPLGLVDGVPTTIKDLVLVRGWPTLRGSRVTDLNQPWDEDAPASARLREQGAVLLGKTTTPEFGWKGVTDSPLDRNYAKSMEYGTNPWRQQRWCRRRSSARNGRAPHRHRRRRLGPHSRGIYWHFRP